MENLTLLFFSKATIVDDFFGIDLVNELDLEVFLTESIVHLRPPPTCKNKKVKDFPNKLCSLLSSLERRCPLEHLWPLDRRNPVLSHEIPSHTYPGPPLDNDASGQAQPELILPHHKKNLALKKGTRSSQSYDVLGIDVKIDQQPPSGGVGLSEYIKFKENWSLHRQSSFDGVTNHHVWRMSIII